jgi:hypothetical protein
MDSVATVSETELTKRQTKGEMGVAVDETRQKRMGREGSAYMLLRIRLWGRDEEDFIAWNYERSGLFSVRSAYKLALELDQANIRYDSCSSVPDGSRSLYKEIWSANVPPKVRLFAWKVTQQGLAT